MGAGAGAAARGDPAARWVPLNVYDFACWARQTIVALSLVKAHRPVRPLPFDLRGAARRRERGGRRAAAPGVRRSRRCAGCCACSTAACALYERRPLAPLRRLALARAERWIVRRQEADGSWGGIQPPWVYSLMALHLRGYPLEHPVMGRGLEGLDGFMVEDRDDSRGSAPRRAEPAPGSLPVAGVGHGAGDARAQRRGGRRRPSRRWSRAAEWLLGRGGHRARRLVGARTRARARRLGVRVRERQLPRRRRHRRGRARARPRRRRHAALRAPIDGAIGRAVRWVGGDAELRRRLGRLRRRQHAVARARAALPGLRRGDRRAERRRDRAHGRDARARSGSATRRPRSAACAG